MKIRLKLFIAFSVVALTGFLLIFSTMKSLMNEMMEDVLWKYARVVSHYDTDKTLAPLIEEISLAKEVATHPHIVTWALNSDDPVYEEVAYETLDLFRWQFSSKNYFIALDANKHYYFDSVETIRSKNIEQYVLSSDFVGDDWYFDIKESSELLNVNVDYDENLGVSKLWINFAIVDDGEFLGVTGTGIDLSPLMERIYNTRLAGIDTIFVDGNQRIQMHRESGILHVSDEQSQSIKLTLFEFMSSEPEYSALIDLMERQKSGQETGGILVYRNNQKSMVSISYIEFLDWYEVTFVDVSSIIDLDALNTMLYFVFVICALAILATFYICERCLLKPLAETNQQVNKMLRTPTSLVSFDDKPSNEIGALMTSIEKVSADVSYTKLSFDKLIEQRTHTLNQISLCDPITGLFNRHGMEKEITHELARCKRENSLFGILWIDLGVDNIPDSPEAAEVFNSKLVRIGNMVQDVIRQYDSACRWADDEFLVLIRTSDPSALFKLSRRLKQLAMDAELFEKPVSIGGAIVSPEMSLKQALAKADSALYLSKCSENGNIKIWVNHQELCESVF